MTPLLRVNIRLHFADTDAAGIVWFGNFARFFEAAEDELFRALGAPRVAFQKRHGFRMPRLDFSCHFRSPVRADDILQMRIGVQHVMERRLTYIFEAFEPQAERLVAVGSCRVASVTHDGFEPCDFPDALKVLFAEVPDLVARQTRGELAIPWT